MSGGINAMPIPLVPLPDRMRQRAMSLPGGGMQVPLHSQPAGVSKPRNFNSNAARQWGKPSLEGAPRDGWGLSGRRQSLDWYGANVAGTSPTAPSPSPQPLMGARRLTHASGEVPSPLYESPDMMYMRQLQQLLDDGVRQSSAARPRRESMTMEQLPEQVEVPSFQGACGGWGGSDWDTLLGFDSPAGVSPGPSWSDSHLEQHPDRDSTGNRWASSPDAHI